MPIICIIYTCHIPVLTLTRNNSWEQNHHECKDSLCVLEAWLNAIHPLERIITWVLLENKFVSYIRYMTDIWIEMSYVIHIPDIWQVKTFYRFQMRAKALPSPSPAKRQLLETRTQADTVRGHTLGHGATKTDNLFHFFLNLNCETQLVWKTENVVAASCGPAQRQYPLSSHC